MLSYLEMETWHLVASLHSGVAEQHVADTNVSVLSVVFSYVIRPRRYRMSTRLTKKQQKALTFRAKQKAKRSGRAEAEQEDVPEQDLEEDEVVDAVVVAEGSGKKRRRHEEDQTDEGAKNTETSKRKANQTAWDEEGDGAGRKSKKEVKQRFILFVGTSNPIPYDLWDGD